MELERLSALQLGRLVNNKEFSPVEVINYFLDRIDKYNSTINAFVYTCPDDALNEAKKLEARILSGEYVGPFAGVPVGLKDFLPSKKGWTNSHGGVKSLIREDDADSMFYKAARSLGAIAVGKTNAPPFGFKGTCDNSLYGPTKNPFNYGYNSGGSSGGTAAAVGSGLIYMGEGGDAGGSIRIPAAWCNCYGYKSSLGTVPSYCRPDGWSATHPYCFNGGITRSVRDSAVLMTEMSQYDPRDPISLPINANKDFESLMQKSLEGIKIAFTPDFDLYPVDPEVAKIVEDAAHKFRDAGATVDRVSFNFKHSLEEFARCWCWSISVDTSLDIYNWAKDDGLFLITDHSDELTDEFIFWNQYAFNTGVHDFREFNEIRTDILDAYEDIFEEYDLIVSPTTCCRPLTNDSNGRVHLDKDPNNYKLKLDPNYDFISFGETFLVNFVGYPAASIPAGLTQIGDLPVGMQIIGKKFKDEDVFAASYTFEQLQPWSYDIAYTNLK